MTRTKVRRKFRNPMRCHVCGVIFDGPTWADASTCVCADCQR